MHVDALGEAHRGEVRGPGEASAGGVRGGGGGGGERARARVVTGGGGGGALGRERGVAREHRGDVRRARADEPGRGAGLGRRRRGEAAHHEARHRARHRARRGEAEAHATRERAMPRESRAPSESFDDERPRRLIEPAQTADRATTTMRLSYCARACGSQHRKRLSSSSSSDRSPHSDAPHAPGNAAPRLVVVVPAALRRRSHERDLLARARAPASQARRLARSPPRARPRRVEGER